MRCSARSRELAERAQSLKQSAFAIEIPVIAYAELVANLDKSALDHLGRELAGGTLDLPARSLRVTQEAWRLSGRSGPAVVLGFGSIPYQAVSFGDDALKTRILAAAGSDVAPINYFPGISDMSFLGQGNGDVAVCAANRPSGARASRLRHRRATQSSISGHGGATTIIGSNEVERALCIRVSPGVVSRVAQSALKAD